MLTAFLIAIPEYTIKMEDLLQGNFTHPDARLCETLICYHLLQKAGLDNGKNLNDIDRQWLKKLGEPRFDDSLRAVKTTSLTEEEKAKLKNIDRVVDGDRVLVRLADKYLAIGPDHDCIKRYADHCIFFNEERKDFTVILRAIPRPPEHSLGDIAHKSSMATPDDCQLFFSSHFDRVIDATTEKTRKFLNNEYISNFNKGLIYYNHPVRNGYGSTNVMRSIRLKIAEIAETHKIYEPTVTFTGFGIGAGKAEIVRLHERDFCWNWTMYTYAFNSPDLFVGGKGLKDYLKFVGKDTHHLIRAQIPNQPTIQEVYGEPWFRGYDYRKAPPKYAITVPDLKCDWAVSLRYPKTRPRDYWPYVRRLFR